MMDLQTKKNNKIAYLAVLVALALVFSYVEVLLPINFGIPGIKLGLANGVIIIALFLFDTKSAFFISVIRVILAAVIFGNAYSFLYSIAGALLSISIMSLIKKTGKMSMIGLSMTGGIFHNIGQLIVAVIIVHQINLLYYGSILILSGVITGFIIGVLSCAVYKRVETYVRL